MLLQDNNRYNRLYIIPQSFVLTYIFVRERSFENVHCNLPQLLSQPPPPLPGLNMQTWRKGG